MQIFMPSKFYVNGKTALPVPYPEIGKYAKYGGQNVYFVRLLKATALSVTAKNKDANLLKSPLSLIRP
jgi:hypothetical protein